MRKRFISGLTAVCIVGFLITNMITSASAVATAVLVGASVAGSLLLGTLFNQMCGGQGYDFTDAFQDAVKLYTDWEEDFDGSARDPIHPVTKVEIDTSKVNIPDNIDFNSVGGTSADKMLIEMQKAINEGLEDGSIEINFDEDGNISMPTTSWCTSVTDIYSRLGVSTSKNGTSRSSYKWVLASQYIDNVLEGWDITFNPTTFGYTTYSYSVPFFINSDNELLFLKLCFQTAKTDTASFSLCYTHPNSMMYDFVTSGITACSSRDSVKDVFYNLNISDDFSSASISMSYAESASDTRFDPCNRTKYLSANYMNKSLEGVSLDNQKITYRGVAMISDTSKFLQAVQEGSIEKDKVVSSIPLTGVENTIGNMGLAGVGSGATKGTVSVNSKTKDITVTNEATKEAELVIEQSKPGDIDIPDSDTIIDKFPFSLPFDLYRMLTIFVAEEKKPIFTVPIKTSFGWSDIEVNVDESFTIDFTQFQIGGVDIVQCLIRTSFYVLFVAFLIKITPKMIQK
ncbi:MAG: hypothetical protein J6L61_02550 [Ruminiclostridium sp.]|nr:hypothetical protein [Ruminiclostridium sp.]